ncbi:signal peptidase II [Sulfuriroseicoccus oceanibius]|uniref:Lipoprotein signal peptidase n=1 Tax=Sulfuriroseicoccus oceanibius TaxID=2707525 RepID=A0A6B3L7E3_9BACT|nr:signal peptidase II [Sulfuriroseicoccus oceanibius]QQL44329.1 signal peptidase II [Sulfuriroseicoccus oceanibius]
MSAKSLILFITLPLYIIDQISKWWIVMNFAPPPSMPAPSNVADLEYHITVIDGFLNIIRVHNTGVAFGMGNGTTWAPFVFLAVPLIALTIITIAWKKKFFIGWTGKAAFALLLAGIFGNLTDRLTQGFALEHLKDESFWTRLMNGYVVDFIDVILPFYGNWPTFNVADSCICVAAVLMVICSWNEEHNKKA